MNRVAIWTNTNRALPMPVPRTCSVIWATRVGWPPSNGRRAELDRQEGDPEEQERHDERHRDQGPLGVAGLRLAERGHAVGDRLHAGEGGRPGREGVQEQEEGDRRQLAAGAGQLGGLLVRVLDRTEAGEHPVAAVADDPAEAHDVHVGGDGEDAAGLTDAAEVPPQQHQDEGGGDRHPVVAQRLDGRRQRGRAGRHAHRHGEHVVDQQRGGAHRGHEVAEVVPGHHVGAAALRVGGDHLPVGQHQDQQQHRHARRQRQGQPDRGPARGDQHEQHLLGRVGGGGDRVRREHRQRHPLADALVDELRRAERRAEQHPLAAVAQRLVAL
jgi:hypothetical protein